VSCTYRIDPSKRLARLTASGRVDVRDMTRTAIAMIEDPAFAPGTDQLVDLSAVTGSDGVFRNLRALASRGPDFRDRLEGGRLAIVAPGDLVFGLARLYVAVGRELPVEARVFRTDHAARSWLGVAAEPGTDAHSG
jgi:hypothetical protein